VILRGYRPDISDIEGPPHDDDLIAAQNTVIAAARSATATSDGNDLHAALSLAADLAAANGPGGVIISLDSGLTDSGVIRFTEPGMTTASPTEIATFVSATASCPHLTDTALVFYGLGYGVAPQQILTVQQRDTISGTWVEVAGTCGATVTATTLIPTTAGPVTPPSHRTRPPVSRSFPAPPSPWTGPSCSSNRTPTPWWTPPLPPRSLMPPPSCSRGTPAGT